MKTTDNIQNNPAVKYLQADLSSVELETSKTRTNAGVKITNQINKEKLDTSKDARKLKRNITVFVCIFVSVWCVCAILIINYAIIRSPNTWVLTTLIGGTTANIIACLKYVIGGIFNNENMSVLQKKV